MQEKPDAGRPFRHLFSTDEPVKGKAGDLLSHIHYAKNLEFIIENSETPISIGLYGAWGSGKSTVLNLLKERLLRDGNPHMYQYVYVDAWKLAPKNIRQELLTEINCQLKVLDQKDLEDRIWNMQVQDMPGKSALGILKKFKLAVFAAGVLLPASYISAILVDNTGLTAALAGLSVTLPALIAMMQTLFSISQEARGSAKKIIPQAESSQQFEKMFNEIINKTLEHKRRIIMAIDNLDRCQSDAAVSILSTIRSFMAKDCCIYIIPCDKNSIIKHLKSAQGESYTDQDAVAFLDKMFQATLVISPHVKGNMEEYVKSQMSGFEGNGKEFGADVAHVLWSMASKNPRKIKQVLYNIVVLYKLAQMREADLVIKKQAITGNTAFLAKIIALREEWPEFYRGLEEHPNLLDLVQKHMGDAKNAEFDRLAYESPYPKADPSNRIRISPSLCAFLYETKLTMVDNIEPFLRLSQESYERDVGDLDYIVSSIRKGKSEAAVRVLEKAKGPQQQERIIKTIMGELDRHVRGQSPDPAFSAVDALLHMYYAAQDQGAGHQNMILDKLDDSVKIDYIRKSILRLDIDLLFPLIISMSLPSQIIVLKEYCPAVYDYEKSNLYYEKILDYFIEYAHVIMHPEYYEVKSTFVRSLATKSMNIEDRGIIKIMDKMRKNPKALHTLIDDVFMTRFINIVKKPNRPMVREVMNLYVKVQDAASANVKKSMFEIMTDAMLEKSLEETDENTHLLLQYVPALSTEGLSAEFANSTHDRIFVLLSKLSKDLLKFFVLMMLMQMFSLISKGRQDKVLESLGSLIEKADDDAIRAFMSEARMNHRKLLDFNLVFAPLLERGIKHSTSDILEFIMSKCPEKKERRVLDAIINVACSNLPQRTRMIKNAYVESAKASDQKKNDRLYSYMMDVGVASKSLEPIVIFEMIALSIKYYSKDTVQGFLGMLFKYINYQSYDMYKTGMRLVSTCMDTIDQSFYDSMYVRIASAFDSKIKGNDEELEPFITFFLKTKFIGYENLNEMAVHAISKVLRTDKPYSHTMILRFLHEYDYHMILILLKDVLNLAQNTQQAKIRDLATMVLTGYADQAPESIRQDIKGFLALGT